MYKGVEKVCLEKIEMWKTLIKINNKIFIKVSNIYKKVKNLNGVYKTTSKK